MKRFVARYLDPASRLGEILFGLIMNLTVTLSAELAAALRPSKARVQIMNLCRRIRG